MIKINTNISALSFSIMSLLILTATIGPEATAFQLTSTSYRDGITKGLNDARCDLNQCHGHGYDPSCPSEHTKTLCSGYARDTAKDGTTSQEMMAATRRLNQLAEMT